MFSGIVTNLGKITFFDKSKKVIGINSNLKNVKLGDSISCNGICLTISKKENKTLFFNLSKETISKTNLSKSRINDIINLEKSLKSGDEISGHLVFGHVDGISKVIKINNLKDSREIVFKTSSKISKFLIEKCSICLNGVSLTVNYVEIIYSNQQNQKKYYRVFVVKRLIVKEGLLKRIQMVVGLKHP